MTAGRDRFAAIALEHLARAVAADELDVALTDITVRVNDSRGALAVSLRAPIPVPPLTAESPEPLTRRLSNAGARIRGRMTELTGREFAAVDLRATRALISPRRVG